MVLFIAHWPNIRQTSFWYNSLTVAAVWEHLIEVRRIFWSPKAFRQLRKIRDREEQVRIYDAVSQLVSFPNCRNVRKIKGAEGLYRLRVGRWRVIFSVSSEAITIEEVKRRDERTYG